MCLFARLSSVAPIALEVTDLSMSPPLLLPLAALWWVQCHWRWVTIRPKADWQKGVPSSSLISWLHKWPSSNHFGRWSPSDRPCAGVVHCAIHLFASHKFLSLIESQSNCRPHTCERPSRVFIRLMRCNTVSCNVASTLALALRVPVHMYTGHPAIKVEVRSLNEQKLTEWQRNA